MGEMDFYDNGILTILRDGKNRTFQQYNYSDFLIQIFESQILKFHFMIIFARDVASERS